MKKIQLLLVFLTSLSLHCFGNVQDRLKQIPLHDQLCMRELVKIMMTWNQAGHVLYFNNKPACLASARLKSPDKQFMDVQWIKGWQAFNKHAHLFSHSNFIFNSCITECSDNYKFIELRLINKTALNKCVTENIAAFQELLGESFEVDDFISSLEKNINLLELIKDNHKLLGILLGYGNESACIFHEKWTLTPYPEETDTYCAIEVRRPPGCKLLPLGFMGNPQSTEVQKLLAVYEKEAEEFWHVYQKKDPLVLFFECVCGELPPGYMEKVDVTSQ